MTYRPPLTWLTDSLKWIGIVLAALLVLAVGGCWVAMEVVWQGTVRDMVPASLEPGFFYSGDDRSPQGLVQFSLGNGARHAIATEGLAFLNRTAGGNWETTPASIERFRPFQDCSGFWCSRSPMAQEASRWLAAPGSYFHLRRALNNERVIVVNPAEKSMIVGYYVD